MTLAVIGQGAVGRALAAAFRAKGLRTIAVEARGAWPDLGEAEAVILAVRDDVIDRVAGENEDRIPEKATVLHCSGAMPASHALASLVGRRRLGTLHPLVSVADGVEFAGVPFAVEGEVARLLALRLGGVPFDVAPGSFALYHAAAVFAANYVVTLLDVAVRLAEKAGLGEEAARQALGHLAGGAVANVRRLGTAKALTGPIARGDEATVARHIESLPAEIRPLYEALAQETRKLARRGPPG